MARRTENLIAVLVLGAAVGLTVLLWRSATFRLFFGWPDGGVWPNFVQAALWVGGAGFAGWYLRDHVGRGLVGWLNRHHDAHAQKRIDDQSSRLGDHFRAEQIKTNQQLAELRAAIRTLHAKLDGS